MRILFDHNTPRGIARHLVTEAKVRGLSGSNGRAFSATTRTSRSRKASDTVSPIFFSAAAVAKTPRPIYIFDLITSTSSCTDPALFFSAADSSSVSLIS
jgi:hypothetical protein